MEKLCAWVTTSQSWPAIGAGSVRPRPTLCLPVHPPLLRQIRPAGEIHETRRPNSLLAAAQFTVRLSQGGPRDPSQSREAKLASSLDGSASRGMRAKQNEAAADGRRASDGIAKCAEGPIGKMWIL